MIMYTDLPPFACGCRVDRDPMSNLSRRRSIWVVSSSAALSGVGIAGYTMLPRQVS